MIKHKVEHIKIITHKLYDSSYIMIITRQLYSSSYTLLYQKYESMNISELFVLFIPRILQSTSSPTKLLALLTQLLLKCKREYKKRGEVFGSK